MKNILITGASGLLGCNLTPYLRSRGYSVKTLSRTKKTDEQADLTDVLQVFTVLNKVKPDVIINLAALTNVDICEENPHLAYLYNVRIVENITKWISEVGDSCHLLQLSTDHVYDGLGPHKENDVNLTNYYGFSKYAGELVASSVNSTILRTNFFGPSECIGRESLSDWIVKALKNNEKITVFSDVSFSPLSLKTLVKLIGFVIAKQQNGLFNLGSKDGLSKAEFAVSLANILSLPIHNMTKDISTSINLKTYRPKDMSMNSSLFEKVFDIKLPTLKNEIKSMKSVYSNEST
jgi:dTDP-4-dehydrorhamnose reductase